MTKPELYKKACMLPLLPGVYIIRDKADEIIYIGKAKRLRTRVSQYFREGVPHDAKVTQMIEHAFGFDVIVCQSEFEALVLEASQIKAHTPKYNILLKDDKGYSYVKVTRGDWPRISAALQKDDDNADYIGPFTLLVCGARDGRDRAELFLAAALQQRVPARFRQGPPLPQRSHRQVHGRVQRQGQLRRLQRGRAGRAADDPPRQEGHPAPAARKDAGGLRPARL